MSIWSPRIFPSQSDKVKMTWRKQRQRERGREGESGLMKFEESGKRDRWILEGGDRVARDPRRLDLERERESDPSSTTAGFGGERERAADGVWWGWTRDWWLGEICGSEPWGRERESVCHEEESEMWTMCVLWSQWVTVTIYSLNETHRFVLTVVLTVVRISFSYYPGMLCNFRSPFA